MTKKELFLSIKYIKVFKSRERLIQQYFERVNPDTLKCIKGLSVMYNIYTHPSLMQ